MNNDLVVVDESEDPFRHMRTAGSINWYPGHIAKAERELQEYLKRVDVVIEVRDARIAGSTAHPDVEAWCGVRPRLVVYTFADVVSSSGMYDWKTWSKKFQNIKGIFWLDARKGGGDMGRLRVALRAASQEVNAKRVAKNIKPRAARCAVIGFPNVGKSSIINKLAGRKVAKTENRAGVTRALTWIRPRDGSELELLDSPGIIPAKHVDQTVAARLAMCGDLGQASYDNRLVAEALLALLIKLPKRYAPEANKLILSRYALNLSEYETPAYFIHDLAEKRFSYDLDIASTVLLADLRNGRLGPICLEPPPHLEPRIFGFDPASVRDRHLSAGNTKALPSSQGLLVPPSGAFPTTGRGSAPPGVDSDTALSPSTSLGTEDEELNRRLAEGDFSGW